jgi:hypothetical protein
MAHSRSSMMNRAVDLSTTLLCVIVVLFGQFAPADQQGDDETIPADRKSPPPHLSY